jgi:hypothetical protein
MQSLDAHMSTGTLADKLMPPNKINVNTSALTATLGQAASNDITVITRGYIFKRA